MDDSSHRENVGREDFTLKVCGRRLVAGWLKPPGVGEPGDSERPVLVFLHEGLGSMEGWRDFPAKLVNLCGLEGFMYDRYGHGLSDPLSSAEADPGYLAREAWEFLPRVLAECAVENPILIGHSDGGTVALMYAARGPKPGATRVAAIITEAAHVFVDDVTRSGIRSAVRSYRKGDLKARLQKYRGSSLDELFGRWSNTWLSNDFSRWNILSLLGEVRCPVLAIQGESDEYGTKAQVDAIVSGVSGRAESFMVPGARHIPHLQAGKLVMERMASFIRGLTSGPLPLVRCPQ